MHMKKYLVLLTDNNVDKVVQVCICM